VLTIAYLNTVWDVDKFSAMDYTLNISSKIVPLEKVVVIYGANALSLLPVVLFISPINVHV